MEVESAKRAGFAYSIIGYSDTEDPWEKVIAEISKRTTSVQKMAIEETHLNVARYEIIKKPTHPQHLSLQRQL